MNRKNVATSLCGIIIWGLIPVIFSSSSTLNLFVFWFLNAIQAIGLSLLFGYAGQISMGQAAFYGIGAYTASILSVKFGIPGYLGVIAGAILTAAIGYALARPILRLRGYYLAMATAAFGLIMSNVFGQWSPVTGGYSGIQGIPSLMGMSQSTPVSFYYLSGAIAILVLIASWRLVRTAQGRAMRSLRESESAARSVGINVAQLKAGVFGLAAGLSGLAGGLYAYYSSYVSPDSFTFDASVNLLLALIIGGITSIWGAVIGAGILTFFPEWLHGLQNAYGLVFGLAVVVILVFNPHGLHGLILDWVRGVQRRRQNGSPNGRLNTIGDDRH